MSVATRRALYGRLAADTTLNDLLATPPATFSKSVFYEYAPQGASFPYVLFNKQSGTPRYSLGSLAFDNEIWMFKGVDRDDDERFGADGVDPIASRLDALLTDGTISISGKTQCYLRRESDLDYAEQSDGVVYRHAGGLFRLIYTS